MKVAYVLGTSAGGTARHVRMLAGGLARRGVIVDVYAPAGTWATPGAPAGAREDVSTALGEAGLGAGTSGGVGAAGVGGGASAGAGEAGVGASASAGAREDVSGGVGEAALGEAGAGAGAPRFAAVEIGDRPRLGRDLAAVWRLRGLLARSRPGVVHAHGLRAGALAALAISGGNKRPRLIVTVHNAAPAGGPAGAVYHVLERLVAHRADQVLCVSGDLESRMRRLGARGVGRALVPAPPAAGPGADAETLARLRAEFGIGRGQDAVPVVLAVARLAPQKGLDTLIEAAARWRDRDQAPLLVIAGTGPLRPVLARRAQAAGVTVRFLGHRDDVPALLAVADVVAVPSVWEGQPLIVQEALRAGRPLVATRVGGIPDLTGEDAALLVPPGDAGALSSAVLSVIDDPALSAQLSESAIKRAGALPSEADALEAALTAYQRLAPN